MKGRNNMLYYEQKLSSIEELELKYLNKYYYFLKLAEEFDVRIDNKECTASVQQRTANEQHRTAEETSKDKLIMVLEKQLEEANKSRANLEKLLDQQQQLTLVSNKKIELLRLELEEKESEKQIDEGINKEEMKKDEKKKWWNFFKYN